MAGHQKLLNPEHSPFNSRVAREHRRVGPVDDLGVERHRNKQQVVWTLASCRVQHISLLNIRLYLPEKGSDHRV